MPWLPVSRLAAPLLLAVALSSTACGGSSGAGPAPGGTTPGDGSTPGGGGTTPGDGTTPGGGGTTPGDEGTGGGGTTPGGGGTAAAPVEVTDAADVYAGAPAETVAAGRPGDVISYLRLGSLTGLDTSWLALYRSTSAVGGRIAVSGLVLVPKLPWTGSGPRPIVAFAHATVGITDDCAPSRTIGSGAYVEAPHVAAALALGWAVALTDYEGLGTPGKHTYAVNRSEAPAVLDSVRAAARVPGTGLDARAPVAIWGYSQGGGAAGAAAEAAPSYAPELDVRGVAAGGTVADPAAVGQASEGSLFYGFTSAASAGLDAAYPELDLWSFLNDAGQAAYLSTASQCVPQLIAGYAFGRTSAYTTSDPRETARWQRRLAENVLGNTRLAMPALVYHGAVDEVIPYAVGTGVRDRWCALGSTVAWKEYAGEHVLTQSLAAADVLSWIADRFAGDAAPSSCP